MDSSQSYCILEDTGTVQPAFAGAATPLRKIHEGDFVLDPARIRQNKTEVDRELKFLPRLRVQRRNTLYTIVWRRQLKGQHTLVFRAAKAQDEFDNNMSVINRLGRGI